MQNLIGEKTRRETPRREPGTTLRFGPGRFAAWPHGHGRALSDGLTLFFKTDDIISTAIFQPEILPEFPHAHKKKRK